MQRPTIGASAVLSIVTILLAITAATATQELANDRDEAEPIRVVVDAVSIDVIVTDREGNHVTDLQPQDFEVYQGGDQQKITNFMYVVAQPSQSPAASEDAESDQPKEAVRQQRRRLRPEQVRRSIGVVVDDLGMSFRSMAYVRDALKEFVDEQVQDSDLVSIAMTGARMGALQQFTVDKRRLHAATKRLRWNPLRRASPFDRGFFARTVAGDPRGLAAYERGIAIGTLGTLRFVIEGMKDLPGRKSVILFSEGFRLWYSEMEGMMGSSYMMTETVREVNEAAHKAGVVIYTVDPRGLEPGGLNAADNVAPLIEARQAEAAEEEDGLPPEVKTLRTPSIDEMQEGGNVEDALRVRMGQYNATKQGLNYLPQATGGLFLHIGNDLNQFLTEVLEDQRGYYLIGYAPPPESIRSGGRRLFPKLTVKVKRSGLRVRTRSSFLGSLEEEPEESDLQDVMAQALTSPFAASDIALDLTSLYEYSPEAGSSVSSWLHIAPDQITFTEGYDKWHTAALEIWAATFGTKDKPVDERRKTYKIRATGETLERIRQDGLAYRVSVPVKKPGSYQLCVVVRDTASNRLGSASQFIEVPDIKKGDLALSGMVILGLDSTAEGKAKPSDGSGDAAPPASMALREFSPGMQLNYALYVYNAQREKKSKQPRIETQIRLFREGKEIYAGETHPYQPDTEVQEGPLLAGGYLDLGSSMPAGEYLLQCTVRDTLAKAELGSLSQWIDFKIVR